MDSKVNTQRTAKAAPKRAPKPKPAEARAKLLAANGVRIVKPGAGRTVGMPEAVNGATSGTTFATWRDGDAKRRAWDGGEFVAIDTRGIAPEAVAAIAAAWNAKAAPVASGDILAVFAVPNAKAAK